MAWRGLVAEFLQVPAVTRAYTAACIVTTAAVQLEILSPFQLYFNPHLVFRRFQETLGHGSSEGSLRPEMGVWAILSSHSALSSGDHKNTSSVLRAKYNREVCRRARHHSCLGHSWASHCSWATQSSWTCWGSLWATSTTSLRTFSPTSLEAKGCC